MVIVISGTGIDMGGNPVSSASQIDSVVMNENGFGGESNLFDDELLKAYYGES